jgi:hypothetical protein
LLDNLDAPNGCIFPWIVNWQKLKVENIFQICFI